MLRIIRKIRELRDTGLNCQENQELRVTKRVT